MHLQQHSLAPAALGVDNHEDAARDGLAPMARQPLQQRDCCLGVCFRAARALPAVLEHPAGSSRRLMDCKVRPGCWSCVQQVPSVAGAQPASSRESCHVLPSQAQGTLRHSSISQHHAPSKPTLSTQQTVKLPPTDVLHLLSCCSACDMCKGSVRLTDLTALADCLDLKGQYHTRNDVADSSVAPSTSLAGICVQARASSYVCTKINMKFLVTITQRAMLATGRLQRRPNTCSADFCTQARGSAAQLRSCSHVAKQSLRRQCWWCASRPCQQRLHQPLLPVLIGKIC